MMIQDSYGIWNRGDVHVGVHITRYTVYRLPLYGIIRKDPAIRLV